LTRETAAAAAPESAPPSRPENESAPVPEPVSEPPRGTITTGITPFHVPSWLVGDDAGAAAAAGGLLRPAAALAPEPLPTRNGPDPVSAYRFSIGDVPAGAGAGARAALMHPALNLLARIQEAQAADEAEAAEMAAATEPPPPMHTVPIDPLAPLKTLTEEEKIALFS
ncbi:hypothetical protein CH338_24400, partial [Rhodoplanes elegans]